MAIDAPRPFCNFEGFNSFRLFTCGIYADFVLFSSTSRIYRKIAVVISVYSAP